MTGLPADLVRPAKLNEVRPPGVLLRVGKYGAPFLVIGNESEPYAVCLDGQYSFRCFKAAGAENWTGLAIENVEFEVEIESAFDLSLYDRAPGLLLRGGSVLTITAIGNDAFGRTVELPVLTNLPAATSGERTAFSKWRVLTTVGDDRRVVWECDIPVEQDW